LNLLKINKLNIKKFEEEIIDVSLLKI